MSAIPRVLILGAGFAGRGVLDELKRLFAPTELQITIVDQNNFTLFTPMLTETAGGMVDAPDIVVSVLGATGDRATFEQGRVEHIDPAKKQVTISIGGVRAGIPETRRDLAYDYLVIALGSVSNYHDISGLEEHSFGIKSIEEAMEIRNRVLALLERADEEEDATERKRLLTFVVGGGGFSGVETMASVNDMVRDLTRHFAHLQPEDVTAIIVQPAGRLLPELTPKLAQYTQQVLQHRGVETQLHTSVTGAGEGWVEVKGKDDTQARRIPCGTLIWAGGVTPSPVIGTSGLHRGRHHGISVDSTCAVPKHEGVWALGDCAEIPVPGHKHTYAPTAQNATREGAVVARNIAAAIRGGQQRPFDYTPVGQLAIVGKRAGVASLYGVQVEGLPAWVLWRAVYLYKLPRFAQRFRVALSWTLDALFGREIVQLPGGRVPVAPPANGEKG